MTDKAIIDKTINIGLSEGEVTQSRVANGANILTPPARTPLWKLYLEKYKDPIIQILLVAVAISLALAFIRNDFVETLGIVAAIFLATTVGFVFECDAARKFRILNALGEEQPVKVRRNGVITMIARKDVVVGDIVIVEVGDEVPADGEILAATDLQINESSLTGEQIAIKMTADEMAAAGLDETAYPANIALRSSMVMNGRGVIKITAVGDKTEIGRVARTSIEETDTKTPLSIQLDKLAKLISKIGSVAAFASFLIFLIHDILTGSVWHTADYFAMLQRVLGYFMMAVTIIVMAVPEGLPMAVTLALALNMRRMLKSNNLVRKLHASETMGAVTVICTDKTGTLTQNKMTVFEMKGVDTADEIRELALAIAVNSTADLDASGRGIGNPTEVALLQWVRAKGFDYNALRRSVKVAEQLPFSTERKYMATTIEHSGATTLLYKGAPEIILAQCNLAADRRQQIESALTGYQQKAMRTLAFAKNDQLQAIVAINDPVRPDVPAAVMQCRRAGIEVKIVTGDTSATAIEIARQIGIFTDDSAEQIGKAVCTGAEFAALTDDEALARVADIKVMSRAKPQDKQRLVQLLQQRGEVVAVTGDGTNDAPALNYAHVGLSLGSGTSVAKQASDITLIDDSFGSIAKAVMWGRSLYRNIQRFLYFQLVVNVTALLLVLGGSIVGTEMPLTVTQILWVNLIMDTFAAMALASLPPSREVMRDKPRRQSDFIITPDMGRGILFCGITFAVIMLFYLVWCEYHNGALGVDRHELTQFFTVFVMMQVWNLLNAKCLGSDYSAMRYIWRDGWLLAVLLIIVVGQWLIVTFGGEMFRTEPLTAAEWLAIVGLTSIVFIIGEIWRKWKRIKASRLTA